MDLVPVEWEVVNLGVGDLDARRVLRPVELTLRDRLLCLVQIAGSDFTALVDPLAIDDLRPLAALLGVQVGALDTMERSRARHAPGGSHTLSAVVERELGAWLDVSQHTSKWRRRPLTEAQARHAALRAEILLRLEAAT